MAIGMSNLTQGGTTASATSGTTASITPSANALVLLTVNAYITGTSQPPQPTITGNGLTWVLIASVNVDNSGSDRQTQFLFRAMGASPSAGTVGISFGATSISRMSWVIDQATGTDTTGTNGSGAIVQSATVIPTAGATSGTVTLAAFADGTNNVSYGCFGLQSSNTATYTWTAGSGFTRLGNITSGNMVPIGSEWKIGDADPGMSWTSSGSLFHEGGIGVEIAVAASGNQSVSVSGKTSAQAFGSITAVGGPVSVAMTGLGSAQAFGTIKANQQFGITGLGSAGAFGTVTASPGGVTKVMTGLASAQQFGTFTPNIAFSVSAVPSAAAFGAPTVTTSGGGQTAPVSGLASAASFGTPVASPGGVTVSVGGVGSPAAFGAVQENQRFSVGGVPTAGSFGSITVATGGTTIPVSGLGSSQAFGSPNVTTPGGEPAFNPALLGGRLRRPWPYR